MRTMVEILRTEHAVRLSSVYPPEGRAFLSEMLSSIALASLPNPSKVQKWRSVLRIDSVTVPDVPLTFLNHCFSSSTSTVSGIKVASRNAPRDERVVSALPRCLANRSPEEAQYDAIEVGHF